MSEKIYDIAICGYGPVGKLLGILLGRAGHKVLIVEKFSGGYPLPRAVTHDSEFARILQTIGLQPDKIPQITAPYDDFYIWRNADGEILQDVDWSGIGPSGWNNTWFFNQPDLEEALDQQVKSLPNVVVHTRTEMLDFDDQGTHVSITAQNEIDETQTFVAKYLIGADGANSIVRRRISPVWHDQGYFFDWLVVDVIMKPHKTFPHIANQMCDPKRPATMVPGGPGRRRWEFMRLENETWEELNQPEKSWQLLEPFGVTPADAELERHSVYRFQAGWAETWKQGRVLIAGDAAHLTPPFAGQGLCAGFRDAMNLYWKLDYVLRGISDDSLLETYGPERTPHVAEFIQFAMELGKIICVLDPAEAKQRDDRMLAAREDRGDSGAPKPPNPQLGKGVHFGTTGGFVSEQSRVCTKKGY